MATLKTIALDEIDVPERLRGVDEAHALAIQASIVEHGLLNPITVRHAPNNKRGAKPYVLVAGAHRLRAIALLDEAAIEAFVVDADRDEGVLIEIEENLFRNELSALERAIAVQAYRDVWERKYGAINPKGGRPRKLPQVEGVFDEDEEPAQNALVLPQQNLVALLEEEAERGGFSANAARRLGLSKAAIERSTFIAQKLAPAVRAAVAGTPIADNAAQLTALARLPAEEQARAPQALKDAELDFSRAMDLVRPSPKPRLTAAEKAYSAVVANFARLTKAQKAAFFDAVRRDLAAAGWTRNEGDAS